MNDIDELLLQSPEYEIIDKIRTSVSYVKDFRLGDVIQWKMESYKTVGSKQLSFTVYLNGKLLAKHIPANRLGSWLEYLKLEDIATQDY